MQRLKIKYKYTQRELHFVSLEMQKEIQKRSREYWQSLLSFGLLTKREHYTGGILEYIEPCSGLIEMPFWNEGEAKDFRGAPLFETSALKGETGTTTPALRIFPFISDGLPITLNKEENGQN
jgi:hypothetical protein